MQHWILSYCVLVLAGAAANAQSPAMKPTPLQPAPADTAQQQLRQARSAQFDDWFQVGGVPGTPLEARDPRTPPSVTTHHILFIDELPAAFADTIIVGRIIGVQSYQSNDHRAIYTESTVAVEQVMSQQGNQAAVGKSIVFDQDGGSIELPGGRVLTNISYGLGVPLQLGERYAMFLTYVPKAQCYKLTKGWWLSGGKAVAMSPDDVGRARDGTSLYDGFPESKLIDALKMLQASYKER